MEFINLKQVILNSHLEEYTIKSSKNVNNHPVELIVKYMLEGKLEQITRHSSTMRCPFSVVSEQNFVSTVACWMKCLGQKLPQ